MKLICCSCGHEHATDAPCIPIGEPRVMGSYTVVKLVNKLHEFDMDAVVELTDPASLIVISRGKVTTIMSF